MTCTKSHSQLEVGLGSDSAARRWSVLQLWPVLSILLPPGSAFCPCWVHSHSSTINDRWQDEDRTLLSSGDSCGRRRFRPGEEALAV